MDKTVANVLFKQWGLVLYTFAKIIFCYNVSSVKGSDIYDTVIKANFLSFSKIVYFLLYVFFNIFCSINKYDKHETTIKNIKKNKN
jgi:hypothetical protein